MENTSDLITKIEALNQACSAFQENVPFIVDEELLKKYLEETSDVLLNRRQKLIVLAGYVFNKRGWQESCQVYEFILKDGKEDVAGAYAVWIATGLDQMKNSLQLALDVRIDIANSLADIIARGSEQEQNDMASSWADYYYYHPSVPERGMHLLKALKWLELTVSKKREDNELDSHTLCQLANTYFELGRTTEAAKIYAEIDLEELEPMGPISREVVLSNTAACMGKSD